MRISQERESQKSKQSSIDPNKKKSKNPLLKSLAFANSNDVESS